jgi:zinc-binding alcohol dehydrogenase/oxidoreductase
MRSAATSASNRWPNRLAAAWRQALGLMHAVLVRPHGELSYEQVDDPRPGPGEVVIELQAASVNRRDVAVRRGVYPFPLPLIPGSDGAGTRRDTGEEIVILPALGWGESEEVPRGDFRILGGPDDGTYAELVKVPEANVYPKPCRFSWGEAAAFPLAALTAYRALFTVAMVRAGETVLVLGAGSGVSCRGSRFSGRRWAARATSPHSSRRSTAEAGGR